MVKIEVKGPIVSNETAWLYHYFGWDACGPKDISEKLEKAAGDDVILEINSPGGVCNYGYEMYTALMEYQGKITAHVITAASAASLLVCAADEALASDACIFMIHNTKSGTNGDYREMQNCADMLREYNEGIINVYVRKTGKTREELQEMMDKETYMSAKAAIEHGFIDGYMFGNPSDTGDSNDESQNSALLQVMNAALPVISEQRTKEIMQILKFEGMEDEGEPHLQSTGNETAAAVSPAATQNLSNITDSEINENDKEGEKRIMTLEEIYGEHPELKAEVNALVEGAREESAKEERRRIEALDAIAASVTTDALNEAKYGDNRMDAKELAYQSLVEDGKKAKSYMKNAEEDAANSGVNEVGTVGQKEETKDAADEMAAVVNARKGGRR